jgi:hypothetical protein
MQYAATFCGYISDTGWPHFLWSIQINNQMFVYKTGIGHCTKNRPEPGRKSVPASLDGEPVRAYVPSQDDVLEALFSDASAEGENFHSWCENLGYKVDSLKAFNTYNSCLENASKLRAALGKEYVQVREQIESRR